jgi:hypothetical protein
VTLRKVRLLTQEPANDSSVVNSQLSAAIHSCRHKLLDLQEHQNQASRFWQVFSKFELTALPHAQYSDFYNIRHQSRITLIDNHPLLIAIEIPVDLSKKEFALAVALARLHRHL